MNIFVFDIETIPDVVAGRRLHKLDDRLSDEGVANAMYALQREKNGSDFLPLHLHQIVAISAVLRTQESFNVWSLGTTSSDEKELISRFFQDLAKYSPILVSWNGGGFDLPVLHYRSLLHNVSAASYWDAGERDNNFKGNHYLNRFHNRHTDLMDVLAGYQRRANAPLEDIACLLGFPGKMGFDGSKVWEQFRKDDLVSIRNYCETDVLNTYLVYLRFELIRANLSSGEYAAECEQVQLFLENSKKEHLQKFLSVWREKTT